MKLQWMMFAGLCVPAFADPTGRVWVAKTFANQLVEADARGDMVRSVPAAQPYGIATDGRILYVNFTRGIEKRGLDGSGPQGVIPHTTPGTGRDLAYDTRRQRLYLANPERHEIKEIDPNNGTVTRRFSYPRTDAGSGMADLVALGVAYDEGRDRIYVSFCSAPNSVNCQYGSAGRPSSVVMEFDAASGRYCGRLFQHPLLVMGLGFDHASQSLWAAVDNHGGNTVERLSLRGQSLFAMQPVNWTYAFGLEYVAPRPVPMVSQVSFKSVTNVGGCPAAVLSFRGGITVTRAGEVRYRLVRSDGSVSSTERVLQFDAPGTKAISETWTISRAYKGWVAVRITAPETFESDKYVFGIGECK